MASRATCGPPSREVSAQRRRRHRRDAGGGRAGRPELSGLGLASKGRDNDHSGSRHTCSGKLFNKDAKFDARDFKWIGRLDSLAFIGVASKRSGITALEDARTREVIAGAPGLSNIPAQAPLVLNKIAGTKFKLISGYAGTGQVFLALERGEVEVGGDVGGRYAIPSRRRHETRGVCADLRSCGASTAGLPHGPDAWRVRPVGRREEVHAGLLADLRYRPVTRCAPRHAGRDS